MTRADAKRIALDAMVVSRKVNQIVHLLKASGERFVFDHADPAQEDFQLIEFYYEPPPPPERITLDFPISLKAHF